MTMSSQCSRRPWLLALILLLAAATADAGVLRVEANERGEVGIEARGVTVAEALRAIGSEVGFAVVIDEGVKRELVDVELSAAPVDAVLRRVLLGRNYAVYSDSEDSPPSVVIVLPPSSRSTRAVHSRSPRTVRGRRR